jgi:hypothetical protein
VEEEEKPKRSDLFADKEDVYGIYLNKYVDRLFDVWNASDKLSLLYVFNSEATFDDKTG